MKTKYILRLKFAMEKRHNNLMELKKTINKTKQTSSDKSVSKEEITKMKNSIYRNTGVVSIRRFRGKRTPQFINLNYTSKNGRYFIVSSNDTKDVYKTRINWKSYNYTTFSRD